MATLQTFQELVVGEGKGFFVGFLREFGCLNWWHLVASGTFCFRARQCKNIATKKTLRSHWPSIPFAYKGLFSDFGYSSEIRHLGLHSTLDMVNMDILVFRVSFGSAFGRLQNMFQYVSINLVQTFWQQMWPVFEPSNGFFLCVALHTWGEGPKRTGHHFLLAQPGWTVGRTQFWPSEFSLQRGKNDRWLAVEEDVVGMHMLWWLGWSFRSFRLVVFEQTRQPGV